MKNIILGFVFMGASIAAIELGKVPLQVTLSGDNGAKVDGTAWNASMLKGKVHTFFYVDSDKKDLNDDLADALVAQHFDRKKVASVAVVNLAATWLPNAIIEVKLKEKQKKFPHTLYVKDKKKILVKKWHLADDNSDILIFDKKGKLIYKKFGRVTAKEIPAVIKLIKKNL